ncbi:hypothetical protein ZWY2020_021897 [Hordeum vulgare]|nr:hypothetical protein ZWY2020_021897 [Hordeum vulgare]
MKLKAADRHAHTPRDASRAHRQAHQWRGPSSPTPCLHTDFTPTRWASPPAPPPPATCVACNPPHHHRARPSHKPSRAPGDQRQQRQQHSSLATHTEFVRVLDLAGALPMALLFPPFLFTSPPSSTSLTNYQ